MKEVRWLCDEYEEKARLEYKILRVLQSEPSFVKVHGFYVSGTASQLVMEKLSGLTIKQFAEKWHKSVSEAEVRPIV